MKATKVITKQGVILNKRLTVDETYKDWNRWPRRVYTWRFTPKNYTSYRFAGLGNEIFARQVLYNIAKTCPVTYFTVNATAESIREDMEAYGWETVPFEEAETWKFKSLKDTPTNALQDTILDEMKQSRTVAIDSASELLLVHKSKEIANLVTAMTHQNRKSQNFHFLLVTEGMQDPQAETMQTFVPVRARKQSPVLIVS